MKRILALSSFLICIQLPISASVIYTFSAGSGSNTFGFSAMLPDFLQIAAGGSTTLSASTFTSCTLPSNSPVGNVCYNAGLSRTATDGTIFLNEIDPAFPSQPISVAPSALFSGVTFAQTGSFTGTIEGVGVPASLTIQATAPEPGTFLSGGLAVLCLAMFRLRNAKRRN